MKKVVLLLCFILLGGIAYSQNVVRKGNTFEQIPTKRGEYKPTPYTYMASDGVKYPIYLSSKGRYFIIKTSKKSGKEYRVYLKEVEKLLSSTK